MPGSEGVIMAKGILLVISRKTPKKHLATQFSVHKICYTC